MSLVAGVVAWTCWGLFAVVWIAGAFYNQQRGPAMKTKSSMPSVAVIIVLVVVAFRFGAGSGANPMGHPLARDLGVELAGAVVLAAATAFTLWARWVLGTMWSSAPMAKEGHELRTGGPYGITRHPIYTGITGMALGSVLATGVSVEAIVLTLGVGVLFQVKIRAEERLMSAQFPGAYERYRHQVPQLVPGLNLLRGSHAR
ncbi:MAG: methyltransferase family protein [Actinomycetota bacterium]